MSEQDRLAAMLQRLADRLPTIDHFVGRQAEIAEFRQLLDTPEGQSLPVWSIWGVGGIGKSALIRRLPDVLRDEYGDLPWARLDIWRAAGGGEPLLALTRLRTELEAGHGVRFGRFDVVWSVIQWQEGGAEPGLAPVRGSLRSAFAVVSALLSPLVATGREAVAPVAPDALRRMPRLKNAIRRMGGTGVVQQLVRLDRGDLLRRLQQAFAQDLAEALPRRQRRACRAVLFIDSYEELWQGRDEATSARGAAQDEWVRTLYAHLREFEDVLLVIAGQQPVAWPETDPAWAALDPEEVARRLKLTRLGGLDTTDSRRLLGAAGVTDGRLQDAIIRCAMADQPEHGAHPLFLATCADIVLLEREQRGSDPSPELFSGIPRADVAAGLAQRFMAALPETIADSVVRALSVPRFFDRELIEARLNVGEDAAGDAYRLLDRLPFTDGDEAGALRMHPLMREAIQRQLADREAEELTGLHEWCRAHWETREADPRAMGESFYHWLHIDPTGALADWLRQAQEACEPRDAARCRALLGIWEGLDITGEAWRQRMGDEAWASGLSSAAYWLDELRPCAWEHGAVLTQAIRCYEAALRVYTQAAFPMNWAMTQNNLGNAYAQLPTGDRGPNLQQAIRCYEAALRVRTEAEFPVDWAMTQNNMGEAYRRVPTGDRKANLRQAIRCYRAALRVRTKTTFARDWAITQSNLGIAYADLPTGHRDANLRRAIRCYEAALSVSTKAAFPVQWAIAQNNLGIALRKLSTGDRRANLWKAIQCYESALEVYTEAQFPVGWAGVQQNRANAYGALPAGDRDANLRQAIHCYEAASRVHTQAEFPVDWARIQNNMGDAYRQLPTGDREANLLQALRCHEAALGVFTEGEFPVDWASARNSLGAAYQELPTGDRGANLQRAIRHYEAALRVRTEAALPSDWAGTQNNLGTAYANLHTGQRAWNLQTAICHYGAALRVYTEAEFPVDWAIVQNNLGIAYRNLPTGDRWANLERGIGCFEAALSVWTEEAFPHYHRIATGNLARARKALEEVGERDDGGEGS